MTKKNCDIKDIVFIVEIQISKYISGEVVVPPGEYNYTFRCMLPAALPTSVEGDKGYIRYSVIVNLDRPMWPDQEFEESLTVLKALNLNENLALRVCECKLFMKSIYLKLFLLTVSPCKRREKNIFHMLFVVLL